MQQTKNYKLNLIETSDTFSPAPLNENAQKTETALDMLDGRVVALEAHKFVAGWFTGNGATQTFELGFTPIVVFLSHEVSGLQYAMAVTEKSALPPSTSTVYPLGITEGGFWVKYSGVLNKPTTNYYYFAIG